MRSIEERSGIGGNGGKRVFISTQADQVPLFVSGPPEHRESDEV